MYLLLLLLLPTAVAAQDDFCLKARELIPGVCQNPTPELVLHALTTTDGSDEWLLDAVEEAIRAVLRQVFEPRSAAELDAFAAELGQIYRDAPDDVASAISSGFLRSTSQSKSVEGTPYAGAAEVFIRLYESYEDPLHPRARRALRTIRYVGGDEYLRELLASLEQPEPCSGPRMSRSAGEPEPPPPENPCPSKSTWCGVAKVLVYGDEEGALVDMYFSTCVRAVKNADGEWGLIRG